VKQLRYFLVILFLPLVAAPLRAQDAPPSLAAAVRSYVEKKGDHELPPFRHALTDLDGDGQADAIVLLLGGNWCGSGGCSMLVFRAAKEGFTFLSASTITKEPIRVSPEKSAGWRTLIVFSTGKGDVLMRFNGTRYPLNPSIQPKATPTQVNAAQVVMKQIIAQ
jgi:hypothetical protein